MSKDPSFFELTNRFMQLAQEEQLQIVPFSEQPRFAKLSESQQARVLWQLKLLIDVCDRLKARGITVRNSREFYREFFDLLQLEAPHGLLDQLGDQEFIDVYDENHQLILANMYFFESLSYSFEDLYCRQWMELFGRDNAQVQPMLYDLSLEMIAGKHQGIVETHYIPRHILWETDSPLRLVGYVIPKLFAPLRKKEKVVAYLCVTQGEPLVTSIHIRHHWLTTR